MELEPCCKYGPRVLRVIPASRDLLIEVFYALCMGSLSIEYKLADHGWADVRFTNGLSGSDRIIVEEGVSYLHDSLEQLADMAIDLQRGAEQAFAAFVNEPGETQLVVRLIDEEAITRSAFMMIG